jgi:hypothetical protein
MAHLLHKATVTAARAADHSANSGTVEKEAIVLWTIFLILLILWLLGVVSGYTLGSFIHILLVIALVVLIIRLIQGRRVL